VVSAVRVDVHPEVERERTHLLLDLEDPAGRIEVR